MVSLLLGLVVVNGIDVIGEEVIVIVKVGVFLVVVMFVRVVGVFRRRMLVVIIIIVVDDCVDLLV